MRRVVLQSIVKLIIKLVGPAMLRQPCTEPQFQILRNTRSKRVVFSMYPVFKVKQGIFGAIGVREDCYSFPQRSLAGAFREVVLRDVSNMADTINKK